MTDPNPLLKRVEALESKVLLLVEAHNELKLRNAALLNENEELKGTIGQKAEEIKNFQNQDKISRIVTSLAEDTHKSTELKLKINEYLKEIDKCIAYLSE